MKTVSPRRQTAVAKTTDEIRGPCCPSPMTSRRRRPAGAAGELTPDVVPLPGCCSSSSAASGRMRGRRFSRTNASPIVARSTVRKITMGVVFFRPAKRIVLCGPAFATTCSTTRWEGGVRASVLLPDDECWKAPAAAFARRTASGLDAARALRSMYGWGRLWASTAAWAADYALDVRFAPEDRLESISLHERRVNDGETCETRGPGEDGGVSARRDGVPVREALLRDGEQIRRFPALRLPIRDLRRAAREAHTCEGEERERAGEDKAAPTRKRKRQSTRE